MKILKNNELKRADWAHFLSTNNYATPFQSPEYYDFFNSVTGSSAQVYSVYENDLILALCVFTLQKEKGIKGFFSKRSIIYGGPVVVDSELGMDALVMLLNAIGKDLKHKAIYSEVRNLHDYKKYKQIYENHGWKYSSHLNFQLNCSSEEIVWNNLNNNRKRQIKKSLKIGVIIEEAKNLEEVHDFYFILNDLYLKKVKKPLPSIEYFLKLFEKKIAKFLLIKFSDRIIGGIVCPFLEDNTIYELYICGMDQEYKEASPSVMATYAAIEYGYKHNMQCFDFLGAGKPGEDYGVRDFKEKFGGQLVENGRFLKIMNPTLYKLGKLALNLNMRLKR
jgi:serine/alanine adding enzyme